MKRTIVSILALLSFAAVAAFAQAPTGKTIHQRKVKQQKRIAQGVKKGSLTPGETAKLEKKEGKINREEHRMRRRDNGKLTRADKKKLTRQQNRMSKKIYRKKHNARKRG